MYDSRTDKHHSQNGDSARCACEWCFPRMTWNRSADKAQALAEETAVGVEPFTLTAAYLAPLDCEADYAPAPTSWTSQSAGWEPTRRRTVIEHVVPTTLPVSGGALPMVDATKRSRVSHWATKDADRIRVWALARVLDVSTEHVVEVLRTIGEFVKDGRSVVAGPVASRLVEAYGY